MPNFEDFYVRVGALNYKVTETKDLKDKDGVKLLGQVTYQNQILEISDAQSEQQKPFTLFHEILHAIFDQYGTEQPSEAFIDLLTYTIPSLLRENPTLLDALLGRRTDNPFNDSN